MNNAANQLQGQILWSRLIAVVEEQAQTLIRTAFSTTVREAGDLSAGVFDVQGRMLAQAVTGTPGHVNAMAASVGFFLERFPINSLNQGDVLVTNDPWHGTGHLNDFTVVTPVFKNGYPVALFAATSHIADVGGLGFGPDGKQVFEEGINLPMGFLFKAGVPNETLFAILRANVRDPRAAEGDLMSLTACNKTGSDRLLESMAEFNLDDLDDVAEMIISSSRDAMLADIRALPAGTWRHHMRVDGYNEPVDFYCEVTISDSGIDVDWNGTSATSPYGINVPLTYAQAYSSFGVRCVIGNDIPNNAGSLSVVRVTAPAGCILNAERPAAVSARHTMGQMLPDVVLGALSEPLKGEVPAEGASCLFGPVFMGGAGVVPGSDGEPFVMNAFYTGGTGARPTKDGLSCTAFPSGVKSTPVEITENAAPLVVWQKEYRPGSGGTGQYRGGVGQIMEFGHLHNEAFYVSKMFDRINHPARGRAISGERAISGKTAPGNAATIGGSGTPARVYIRNGPDLKGMGRELIPAGCSMVLETAGGGGLGSEKDRTQALLEQDKLSGLT